MKKILSVAAPIAGFALGGPLGGVLGASVGSAFGADDSAKKQAQAQLAGIDKSNAHLMQMFDKQTALNEPFRQAGISALPGLQAAANQPVNPFSFDYQQYFASPEYAALQQQAESGVLRNASATGGLRSGGSSVALSAIAPQLAQQGRADAMNAYSLNQAAQTDQFNRLMGLTGVGQGATQQITSQAGQLGQNLSNNALMAGNVNANRYAQQGNALQGLMGDLGGLSMGRLRGFI